MEEAIFLHRFFWFDGLRFAFRELGTKRGSQNVLKNLETLKTFFTLRILYAL